MMFGKNKITKPQRVADFNTSGTINVQEIFYSIQGEGPHSGRPALFVRLSGCLLSCLYCDTEFDSPQWTPKVETLAGHLITLADANKTNLVVITGGEPFIQVGLERLVQWLISSGLEVQLETSGTVYRELPFENSRLSIICSPKTGRLAPKLASHIDAYKYVIQQGCQDPDDGLPNISPETERPLRLARPPADFSGPVYVMPCDAHNDAKSKENTKETTKIALKHGYRVCLQVHKYLNVE